MANRLKGEVEFEVGGEKFTFRLGVNELISMQGDFGLAEDDSGFLSFLDGLQRKPSLKAIRIVILNGLKRDRPQMTLDDAGDILTELGVDRLAPIIKEALRWALPDKETSAAGKKGGPPRPSLGPRSK